MGLFDKFFSKDRKYVTYEKVYNPPGQHMRILKNSLEIMEKTLNPETFFSRARLAEEKAMYCESEPNIIWNGMNCAQIYNMLSDRKKAAKLHKQFIDRLFKAGREDNLAYQLWDVGYDMDQSTLDYYVERLNGKLFHFCKIRFDGTDKLYTYITKNRSVKAGDSVTIPTGNGFAPNSKLKMVVEAFDAPLESLEFELQQLRCVEDTLTNITCPNCGASIEVDVGEKTGSCPYCKTNFYLLR